MKRVAAIIGMAALAAAALAWDQAKLQAQPQSQAQLQAQAQFTPGMRSVKIAVNDFQKSIAFYTALGMKPGTNRDTTWELVWDARTQNSGIVMASPEYAKNAKMSRGGTYLMIMTPDVKAVANKLRGQGYPDVAEPRAMGTMVTVLMLTDPDGNRVELMGPLT